MNLTKLFLRLPSVFQNLLISVYNYKEYKRRYGGKYHFYKEQFSKNATLSLADLKDIQEKRFEEFFLFVKSNSPFYKNLYKNITEVSLNSLQKLPVIDKEEIRKNIEDVYTISKKEGIHSKTGGTTGKALEVLFTDDNMQERFAMLDHFRAQFGYKLGKKTAWFSGKALLAPKDIKRNKFWKEDYFYKVRYYSTFHIKDSYLKFYVENLIEYQPEYIVGFPSSIGEIAKYGLTHGYEFPKGQIKAIFPTAETVTLETKRPIEKFFHSKVYDQYASSEGAPFIFQCKEDNLHMELQSGIFEVLDENKLPADSGKFIFTSFTTKGTPLIRYDIGDGIILSDKICSCGNNNPLVKEILGRIDDYIYSPENGKINLGNVSNTLKGTHGIVKFQVIQDDLNKILIKLVVDKTSYSNKDLIVFKQNWRERVGEVMEINFEVVNEIKSELSGKYRMVKNNIKHLVDKV